MAVRNQEIRYPSANGKDTIVAQVWFDDSAEPCCILQIIHGMCEYMGRYADFAAFMARNGVIVCGNDHVGHGKSKGSDGYGYFADRGGDGILVDDVRELNRMISARYPRLPIVLLGHSMGSFICRSYIATYHDNYSGIILSGTAGDNPGTGIGLLLAKCLCSTRGAKYRSKLLTNMAFGSYNKRYEEKRTDYDWLSRDTNIVDRYASDEACTFQFTASAYADLFRLLRSISGNAWARSIPKDRPYYLMSGSMDPVGGYSKGVQQVYGRLSKADIDDITLKLYEGGRHEMLNEINRQDVYRDLLSWVNRVTAESGGTAAADSGKLHV